MSRCRWGPLRSCCHCAVSHSFSLMTWHLQSLRPSTASGSAHLGSIVVEMTDVQSIGAELAPCGTLPRKGHLGFTCIITSDFVRVACTAADNAILQKRHLELLLLGINTHTTWCSDLVWNGCFSVSGCRRAASTCWSVSECGRWQFAQHTAVSTRCGHAVVWSRRRQTHHCRG